jgi:uncharacterized membrane protein YfcA
MALAATAVDVAGIRLTPLELLLSVAVLLLGGYLKGTVGFAVGLVTISGLVQLLPPKPTVIALTIPFLASNLVVLARDGVPIEFVRGQLPFLATLTVGLLVGVAGLGVLSEEAIYLLLAVYIGGFLVFQRYDRLVDGYTESRISGPIAGALAGLLGGIVGAPGPPMVTHAYLNTIGESKKLFVTATSTLFLAAHVIRLGFLYAGDLLHVQELTLGVLFSIPIFAGVLVGIASRSYVDSDTFERAVQLLLVLIGVNLLRNGLGL